MLDLSGAREKIKRADKHILDLQDALRPVTDSKSYSVESKPDLQTQEVVFYVTKLPVIDAGIALIAGDALQNLRSALDYLIWSAVLMNGGSPNTLTGFPISDTQPTTKQQIASFEGKVQGASKDVVNMVRSTKPYQTGNNWLWKLHRLNNINKHRALVTVGVSLGGMSTGDSQLLRTVRPTFGIELKEGGELLRGDLSAYAHGHVHFRFDVAINEPPVTQRVPLMVLMTMRGTHVADAIERFDAPACP